MIASTQSEAVDCESGWCRSFEGELSKMGGLSCQIAQYVSQDTLNCASYIKVLVEISTLKPLLLVT